MWSSSPAPTALAKPSCRARSADEFYVHKQTLEAGRPAILRRNLGSKAIKMVYGDEAKAGKSVKTVDVDAADRARFCLTDEEVTNLAKQAMIIEALRPPDGHRMGQGR